MKITKKIKEGIFAFFKPETRLFTHLIEHLKLTLKALKILTEIIKEEDLDVSFSKVKDIEILEKKGDEIIYNITQNILKGAVTLTVQHNLIGLINTIDDILDTIHFLSKDVHRIKESFELKEIDKIGIMNDFEYNIQHSIKVVEKLKKLLEEAAAGNDIEKIIQLRNEIEELEEKGDEIKDRTMEKLYMHGLKLDPVLFMLIRSYIFDIDDIEDSCEDAANMITTVLITLLS